MCHAFGRWLNTWPPEALRVFVYATIIRALVLPVPVLAADFSGPWVAPLTDGMVISADGRILPDTPNGVTLATVAGASLLSPAIPITLHGPRFARKVTVPRGTTFRILATAYSSTPDQTDSSPFITASGTHVHDGTIAVNFLPFGTKVRFPDYQGHKVYTVEDRHHPRLSSRADIWLPSRGAAIQFGARVLQMEVVE